MPQCMFCRGWFLSEIDTLQGSSCECGENVCEEDKRAEFAASHQHLWVRRRDGKACVDCGARWFGSSDLTAEERQAISERQNLAEAFKA